MVTIIHYGMGNPGSIVNALRRIGVQATVGSSPEDILWADKLILPGIGSFDNGIKNLTKLHLISALEKKVIDDEIPILGICLGMQLFSKKSEEGILNGFGWIDAETKKFSFEKIHHSLKIPHMGWNSLHIKNGNSIIDGVKMDDRFYFVHSYHLSEIDEKYVVATTTYGYEFPSIIQKKNIIGIQCHPERSHRSGLILLKNFLKM